MLNIMEAFSYVRPHKHENPEMKSKTDLIIQLMLRTLHPGHYPKENLE
jgi:hypothetical protein